MNVAAIIIAVQTWQTDARVHPLTCGNDKGHRLLYASEVNGRVVLLCPDCDYEQTLIPEIVLRRTGLNLD
jgi:hypothetical protein